MPLHEDYESPKWDENILGRPTSPIEKKFMQRINHQRNVKMLDAIAGHSKTHKQVFVAVGTMHLLGKEGLIEGLKTAGFTVELIGKGTK